MNHSFITTKGNVKPATIAAFIERVVDNKFGSNATIVKSNDDKWFDITFYDNDNYGHVGSLSVSILSQRKLSFRKGHSEFSVFLQYWLANTIGIQFKGIRSDEGVNDKWKPEMKAKNYIEWLDYKENNLRKILKENNMNDEWVEHRQRIRKALLKAVPKCLHEL
ncbi:MAG TPA: hypothetical protein VMW91_02960 [Desulfosporosinus sp.]|nr:hypothetical protein [Desulfosporosinus sp.]